VTGTARFRKGRRRPPAHWGLLAFGLVTLFIALLLQGYGRHQLGGSGTALPATQEAASVPGDGAVVYRGAAGLTSRGLPARTVALTFDDGPDAKWTPRILDVLQQQHVPATFFVVGSRVAEQGGLIRRILGEGHEIGSHTYTHENLATLPAWRSRLELSLTQLALAGADGVNTSLFRPPYSATPDALTTRDLAMLRRVTDAGYVVALSDRDSRDWQRPGVDQIVANSAPVGSAGTILLMHDAGGDRSQTVAALPEVIARYRAAGFQFTTLTGGLGLAPGAADREVGGVRRWQGDAMVLAVSIANGLTFLITWLLLPLGVLSVLRLLLLMAFARWHVGIVGRRQGEGEWEPPVSLLVPAYNEAVGIEATLRSIAGTYPDLQVVVIDDGSTDGTADIAEALGLPGVEVVRQANAGKAAALNTGLTYVRHDIVVMVDGDTVFEPDTVRQLVQPLRDPAVGAVSGNTKVGNRSGILGRWQHLEYVIGFNLDRRMYDVLNCMPTVPGAAGAFRREALEAVGGVSTDTLAEDTDLTMAVTRAGWRVVYEERARAWTEAPATLNALWRQRYRWCYGTLQSIWKHRRAVVEGGPGKSLGLFGLPYLMLFQVLLPLLAPVIDVFAVYGLLFLDPLKVVAFWFGYLVLQLAGGAYALRLDKESLKPLWTLPLQQFVYRQLMYLIVLASVISAFAGIRLPWHKLERTGNVTIQPQG
jgi:cellulose synthase/poly-beta-1,6-N-acetylglucosamine synthase-like glycosyltransferase/peptidoglycan/xylan/chitin deacetylase (PgdA/CDA1 family)